MSIFRRGKKSDEVAETEAEQAADPTDEATDPTGESEVPAQSEEPAQADRSSGPYDVSEIDPDDDTRLDLGALRIAGAPGMELRLEVDEEQQQVVGATAVLGESAVQLQAFAAPRTAGVWDDIREEIAASIVAQGGTAEQKHGELGRELLARMPQAGPDGRTVYAPARFVGVDGPRWFLRAVLSGRAAVEPQAAEPLMQVVRNIVVVRGDSAMPPRELLPLHLPEQAAETQSEQEQGRSADDLNPFERGPEITEVR